MDSDLVRFENKYGRVNIDDVIEYCKAFKIDIESDLGLTNSYNYGKKLCELFNIDNLGKVILDGMEISLLDVYGLINKGVEIVNICSSKLVEYKRYLH